MDIIKRHEDDMLEWSCAEAEEVLESQATVQEVIKCTWTNEKRRRHIGWSALRLRVANGTLHADGHRALRVGVRKQVSGKVPAELEWRKLIREPTNSETKMISVLKKSIGEAIRRWNLVARSDSGDSIPVLVKGVLSRGSKI